MSSSNIMTLEDVKRARENTPTMVFTSKRGKDKSLSTKVRMDSVLSQREIEQIDKEFVDYYDYEKL